MIRIKTRSEQRLAQLERVGRPLTIDESDELRRCLHAVYTHKWRANRIAVHRAEEMTLLAKLEAESLQPELYRNERP